MADPRQLTVAEVKRLAQLAARTADAELVIVTVTVFGADDRKMVTITDNIL